MKKEQLLENGSRETGDFELRLEASALLTICTFDNVGGLCRMFQHGRLQKPSAQRIVLTLDGLPLGAEPHELKR